MNTLSGSEHQVNQIIIFGRQVSVAVLGIEIAALVAVYYTLLFTGFTHVSLLHPFIYGLTFNDMLDHLLQGQFDVDPVIIGNEGFVHDSKTYAYFGILPALLRLPLIVLPEWRSIDVTLVSCVAATALAAYFKLRATVAAARRLQPTRLRDLTFLALVVSMLFAGAQVQFAAPSIYVEVVCWANAFAAAFVYCAMEGLLSRFSLRRLMAMAVLAGLTVLTRVSTGMGLYAALGLLLPWIVWSEAVDRQRWRALLSRRVIAPIAILGAFAFACGAVNFGRWGNPFIFADQTENLINRHMYPERLGVFNRYGDFSIVRIGYGLMYYFLPLWAIISHNHEFMFASFQRRTVASIDMPPSSFFLTDPLLMLLTGVFLWLALSRRTPMGLSRRSCGVLLAGLVVPALMMLMFEYMALRYRVEFYPFLTAAALFGFYAMCARERWVPPGWLGGTIVAAAALGIIASHFILALYWLSLPGPPDRSGVLEEGWTHFYRSRFDSVLRNSHSF
jgi:hypothetical protein